MRSAVVNVSLAGSKQILQQACVGSGNGSGGPTIWLSVAASENV